ncbi:hypothetical protein FDI23_gp144 [Serratia phage CHI14]|uniref:Uncharacterized protein n=2 Tax=Winklervirus chi14 TaxID=2560752 RepID=A0A1Z1LYR7_9CAUD|nr:hypothetical protein FDI23_gp144 [Serratia phage CHI14]ARW57694.1 hypothetical protein [Serratia phage CHI14]ARW57969.1 hypothetical protein [Serratia phage CBH8]UJJ22269.1 hypothetical protein [Erwinia phage Virsaitis27]UYM28923.1 hypothetical protein [Serratia phage vB_SspM_LC53]
MEFIKKIFKAIKIMFIFALVFGAFTFAFIWDIIVINLNYF